jgi:hypothetical protein
MRSISAFAELFYLSKPFLSALSLASFALQSLMASLRKLYSCHHRKYTYVVWSILSSLWLIFHGDRWFLSIAKSRIENISFCQEALVKKF